MTERQREFFYVRKMNQLIESARNQGGPKILMVELNMIKNLLTLVKGTANQYKEAYLLMKFLMLCNNLE